jgi:polyamine oxidase
VQPPDLHVKITSQSTSLSPNGLRQVQDWQGQCTLVTLPLGVLKHNPPKFVPELPLRRREAINRLGFGLLNKIVLKYDHAWWSSAKGEAFAFAHSASFMLLPDFDKDPARLQGPKGGKLEQIHRGAFPGRSQEEREKNPLAVAIIDLHTLSNIPALEFMIGGDIADALEECTDEQVAAWAHAVVADYLGPFMAATGADGKATIPRQVKDKVPEPTKVHVTRWRSDRFAFGSYAYSPAHGDGEQGSTPLDFLELSRTLWGRVFWAGEHTEVDSYASAHGAWLSGDREGRKILRNLAGWTNSL